MSEKAGSTYTPETRRPIHNGGPDALQLHELDQIAGQRTRLETEYAFEQPQDKTFDQYYDEYLDQRLARNGIVDSPDDTTQHEAYMHAKGVYRRVADTDRVDWIAPREGNNLADRHLMHNELRDHYGAQRHFESAAVTSISDTPNNTAHQSENDDTRLIDTVELGNEHERNTEALARLKHEAFAAKVNGPAFGQGAKDLKEQYLAAEDAYIAAVRAQIEADIAEKGYQDDAVRDYITQQVNERIKADAAAQRDELISNGGHKARFMEKYANLSTGKKIAATVGLGLAGAGAGFLVGTLGAGIATTVAAVGAIRYGRSYATRLSKIYKRDKDVPTYTAETSDGNVYDEGLDFLRNASVSKMEKAEKIKRRAVYGAIGAVALGGAAGVLAHGVADAVADRGGLWNAIENRWNNVRPAFNDPDHSHWPAGYVQHPDGLVTDMPRLWHGDIDIETPTPPVAEPINPHSGGLDTTPDPDSGETTNGHAADKLDWKYGNDELRIDNGEGWYNELRQMGVKEADRAELLKAIGPKLEDRGLAYRENGEWRINMPDNGKLRESDIKMIATIAHDHDIHTNYDKYFDTSSDTAAVLDRDAATEFAKGRDELTIARGEGGYEFAREIGIDDVADRAAVWNGTAPSLQDSGLSYFDQSHDDWRINMTNDGVMPMSAVEAMAETAQDHDIETDYSQFFEGDSDTVSGASETAAKTASEANTFVTSELGSNFSTSDTGAYYRDVLVNVDATHRAELLNEAANSLQYMTDSNDNALATRSNGEWHFREVKYLPSEATKLLNEIATKHDWTLAA